MKTYKYNRNFIITAGVIKRRYGAARRYVLYLLIILSFNSCKKLVEIPPPSNTITTGQVFADSIDAAAAISGIYSRIQYGTTDMSFCNGAETILCGLSSDELISFRADNYIRFYSNELVPNESGIFFFWQQPYGFIYHANACIEALQRSSNLSQSARNQFLGEAKFFRSLFYFYLVNLFGDVPYIVLTDWRQTDTIGRTRASIIYQKIIADLEEAGNLLGDDYSFSSGQRTRVNKQVVIAFLARVYLFMENWKDAEARASLIINNAQFSLESDLNNVFVTNSTESILQWQLNTSYFPYNCTAIGRRILPTSSRLPPSYYMSNQLLNSFEVGDLRRSYWVNQTTFNGTSYNYPFKYKAGQPLMEISGVPTEYFTVFRLAEQYLIRAEARAQLGDIAGALSDLNIIRNRAGLANSNATTQVGLLTDILHERQIELFAEMGHRWLDLKRTRKIDAVMSVVTPQKGIGNAWKSYQQLFPIPSNQLSLNPFLRQNPGYQ